MKLIKTALIAVAALALTACASQAQTAYYQAIQQISKDQAEAKAKAHAAVAKLASEGDAQAKGMGVMFFALEAAKANNNPVQVAAPQNEALEWAKLLVPGAVQAAGIVTQYKLGVVQSDNAVKNHATTFGTIKDISIEAIRKEPAPPVIVQVPMPVEATPTP